MKQEIYDCFVNDLSDPEKRLNYFRNICTYGGCAGPMAAALESTRIIEAEDLVENSRIVGDIRGVGLFCGIEFIRNKETKGLISEGEMEALMGNMMAQNVIVGRTNSSFSGLNTVMSFASSLIITKEQVDRVVMAVRNAIEKGF